MDKQTIRLIHPAGMTAMICRIFVAAGALEKEAEAIASNLVDSNLAGHDSHGVGMVPAYMEGIKSRPLFSGWLFHLERTPGRQKFRYCVGLERARDDVFVPASGIDGPRHYACTAHPSLHRETAA